MTTLDPRAQALRLWKTHGGDQHGPHIETLAMPLDRFEGFVDALSAALSQPQAGNPVRVYEPYPGAFDSILGAVSPQPNAGEPVKVWISELDLQFIREGHFREAKVFNYEDEHRVPLYASPQPANPAQVTDAKLHPLEAYADSYAQMARMGDGKVDCRSVEIDIRQNMIPATAAIGAGGQAVANDAGVKLAKAMWGVDLAPSALSQPHPADERVVEALRECMQVLSAVETNATAYPRVYKAAAKAVKAGLAALVQEGRS